MTQTRRWAWLTIALVAALLGCGKSKVAPIVGSTPTFPEIAELYPAARTERVDYRIPEIWARFAEALDPATVSTTTVFLKLDTVRLPIDVRWEPDDLRLVIHPRQPLPLSETFTVELGPDIETAAGKRFGSTYWWQFTVGGLRHLEHPSPPDGAEGQSPFAPLLWDRTEPSAGTVEYDVYMGTDSAAIAARSVPPVTTTVFADHFRSDRAWTRGTRHYWAVTARNVTLGQREDGPVWSFTTMPAGAPLDSISIPAVRWGYIAPNGSVSCNNTSLVVGSSVNNMLVFDVAGVRPLRRIASARIKMFITTGTTPPGSTIFSTTRPLSRTSCPFTGGQAPVAERALAFNINVGTGSTEFSYASDALSFHLAAMHQGLPTANGFTLQTTARSVIYAVPPTLVLHFYP